MSWLILLVFTKSKQRNTFQVREGRREQNRVKETKRQGEGKRANGRHVTD